MKIRREDLYDYIKYFLEDNEYSIGLHGINKNKEKNFSKDISDIPNSIMKNGLNIYKNRSMNGTVAFFGRTDLKSEENYVRDKLNHYDYGCDDYIIVATPVILKSDHGKDLFIGSPNLNSKYISNMETSTGYEVTTLAEFVLPDTKNDYEVIPKEFIFGKFKKLNDAFIEVEPNIYHMSWLGNKVSDEKYEQAKNCFPVTKLLTLSDDTKEDEIKKYLKTDRNQNLYYLYIKNKYFAIIETLEQCLEEIKRRKSKKNNFTNQTNEEQLNEMFDYFEDEKENNDIKHK